MKPGKETTAVDLTREGVLSRVCGRRVLSCVGHAWQVAGWGMDCSWGLRGMAMLPWRGGGQSWVAPFGA